MIAIVDYGIGNLGSIKNMFRRVNIDTVITSSENDISDSGGILLPGVGAFDAGMSNLERSGLIPVLEKVATAGNIPILGICLGMQLMTKGSEEGRLPGLGWVNATCRRFRPSNPKLKVPHMGWGHVRLKRESRLFTGIAHPRFYFLHSYFVICERSKDIVGETWHSDTFVSAFAKGSIFGVQFHPEKSHRFGMQLFRNFATLTR